MRLLGVPARTGEPHGFCSDLRFTFTVDLLEDGGLSAGDVGLEGLDGLLSRLVDRGNREADFAASCICALADVAWRGPSSILVLVFMLAPAESLRLRLRGDVCSGVLWVSTSSKAGVTPRYHAVGDDGETS